MNNGFVSQVFVRSCFETLDLGQGMGSARFAGPQGFNRPETTLPQLKQRLLRAELEKTSDPLLIKSICGAANQAAALAWSSQQPLNVFPELFEAFVAEIRENRREEPAQEALVCDEAVE